MSVPADEMRRRRLPVAQPAAQQLALPAPAPAAPAPVAPRPDTMMVDRAGSASISNIQPRPATTAGTGPALGARPSVMTAAPGQPPSMFPRSPAGATRLPPGVTAPFGPTPVANPALAPNTAAASMSAPPAATPAPAAPAAPAAAAAQQPAAFRAGEAAGRVARGAAATARLGSAPVPSQPGRLSGIGIDKTVPGTPGRVAAPLVALTAGANAAQSMGTPTEQVAARFSTTPGEPGTIGGEAKNALMRAGYIASNTVADIGDIGTWGVNLVRGMAGAEPVDSFRALGTSPMEQHMLDQQQYGQDRAQRLAIRDQVNGPAPAAADPNVTGPIPVAADSPFANVQSGSSGPADAVLGSYTDASGQTVQLTASEAQRRAGQLPIASGPVVASGDNFAFSTGPRTETAAGALGAQPQQQRREPGFVMPRDNQRGTLERIDKAIADIGPMDRRGRRSAVADLLGLRARTESGTLDRASADGRNAADLAQRSAASELAAEVDREQIAASTANQRRQNTQTITDAQGNTFAVDGTTLTPLTTPDGQQFKAATKQDTSIQDLAAKLLQESMASGMVTDPQAAAAQAVQTAQALQSQLAGGQPQAAAPTPEQFMSAAKAANPSWSDEQLTAEYQRRYGGR